jgi:hypothetical protein
MARIEGQTAGQDRGRQLGQSLQKTVPRRDGPMFTRLNMKCAQRVPPAQPLVGLPCSRPIVGSLVLGDNSRVMGESGD